MSPRPERQKLIRTTVLSPETPIENECSASRKHTSTSNRSLPSIRGRLLSALTVQLALFSATPLANAQALPASDAQLPSILQDYLYGLTPVILRATRDISTAVPDNTTPGKAPINQFAYVDTLLTPQTQTIVRSEADTLYTTAWLDLLREPLILHAPDTGGRFYLIPMLDAYSNVFASIGSRTTGDGPGDYAIVGPDWRGTMPENVSGVFRAPTNTVWLLGRTLVRGPADLASAAAVAHQFLLIPLSAYPEYLRAGSYLPPSGLPFKQPNSDFDQRPLLDSPGFSAPEFFDFLLPYALLNSPPAVESRQATELVLDGFLAQRQMNPTVKAQALDAITAAALHDGTLENGWSVKFHIGSYGSDYLLRDATALFGLGANVPADAVYFNASNVNGVPLSGSDRYVIHFLRQQTPPAHGFWSLTVYDQQGFLVANQIDRYDVGSETGLVTNPDGSLDIFLQVAPPDTKQSNWLPVPAGPFSMSLRIYWPDQSVLSGTWTPPPIFAASTALPGKNQGNSALHQSDRSLD